MATVFLAVPKDVHVGVKRNEICEEEKWMQRVR